MRAADLTGQRFNRLLVVSLEGRRIKCGRSRWLWRCECDCGTETVVEGGCLRSGDSKSCGCLWSGPNTLCIPNADWIKDKVAVNPETGCWLWLGEMEGETGYGKGCGSISQTRLAHRVVYERWTGKPIQRNLDLDHLCRVRRCVNPAHLEPVTRSENLRRGMTGKHFRGRTTCSKGHPLSGRNVIAGKRRWVNSDGLTTAYVTRTCRI